MKPALVLGLALAANAMTADSGDNNELFVAPTGKLNDHIQRFPGKYIMYDEVADDELAVKYVHLSHTPIPEYVAYDDDELLIRPLAPHIAADDAADDELAFRIPRIVVDRNLHKPAKNHTSEARPHLVKPAKNLTSEALVRDDAADDELRIFDKDRLQNDGIRRFYTPYFDKETGQWKVAAGQYNKLAADDELAYVPPVLADDELAITPEQYHRVQNLGSIHARFDEVADDELGVKYIHLPIAETMAYDDDELAVKYVHLPHIPAPEYVAYDDDEFVARKPRKDDSQRIKEHITSKGWTRPEAADDELVVAARDITFNHHPFDKNGHVLRDNIGRPVRPVLSRYDEVADDELAVRNPSADQYQRLQNSKNLIYSKFDELADDELAYLGHLINERVTEKPSHGKIKERSQMKRKLRPIVDEAPLAQN